MKPKYSENTYFTEQILLLRNIKTRLILIGIVFVVIIFLSSASILAPISFVGIFILVFLYASYDKQLKELTNTPKVVIDVERE